MILTSPLGLLALLAIPVIVAIHLFRKRFPAHQIAGLFLWQTGRKTPEGGGKLAKLPITASLLLECLAALALALILAGLRLSSAGLSQHLVVVLDDTASMAAVDLRGESARDRAVRRVLTEVERLGSAARVTLIQSGERPTVLAGPAAFSLEAKTALDSWRPASLNHSLGLATGLARELAGQTGRLMVMSDIRPAAPEEGVLWVSLGEPLANVGIIAAQRTTSLDPARGTLSLTLGNNSPSGTRRRLTVSAAGKDVLAREVDVPPGASSLTVPIPSGLPPVHLTISDDALARDNHVVLVEPRAQVVGVDNRLAEGRGRQAVAKALSAVSGVTRSEPGHLAFVDASGLDRPSAAGLWRVGFGRPPAGWLDDQEPADLVGPFVLEKRNPLLLGVTLNGVVWSGAGGLRAGAVRPLVSSGNQVLLGTVAASANSESAILFNLDLDTTNLIRAPDWPILVSNLIELRRQNLAGPERWNYRVGEWVRLRLERDPEAPLRIRCGPFERALPSSRLLEFTAPSPGGLLQILEGDEVLFELGVNFLDEVETNLPNQATADDGAARPASGSPAESGPASDLLFWILIAIASTAILLNWSLLVPKRLDLVRR